MKKVKPSIRKIHPELKAFNQSGGLFDVEPCDLDLNVGKWCVKVSPTCTADRGVHHIDATQKLYDGSVAYRVTTSENSFGCPMRPDEVVIFDSELDAWLFTHPLTRKE